MAEFRNWDCFDQHWVRIGWPAAIQLLTSGWKFSTFPYFKERCVELYNRCTVLHSNVACPWYSPWIALLYGDRPSAAGSRAVGRINTRVLAFSYGKSCFQVIRFLLYGEGLSCLDMQTCSTNLSSGALIALSFYARIYAHFIYGAHAWIDDGLFFNSGGFSDSKKNLAE